MFLNLKIQIILFRYEPTAEMHPDIDTEQDRVIFIKSVAEFMVSLFYFMTDCY